MNSVVTIIAETFDSNPAVNWLIKQGSSRKRHIQNLAKYAFMKAWIRDGVYISTNEKGVALCYRFNKKKFSLLVLWYQLKFALTSIEVSRLPKVLKREAYRAQLRPESGAYYYFWFLSVLPEGRGAGFELKNAVFEQATKEHLPVYLETSIERNQKIYEHIGFQTYHYWKDEKEGIQFWFLKWEPSQHKIQ
jgi:hypothetical protein